MSAGTADLVQLIDLSLGSQPSGVVNFNFLHTLMHAIVSRLGAVESARLLAGVDSRDGGVVEAGARTREAQQDAASVAASKDGVAGVAAGASKDGVAGVAAGPGKDGVAGVAADASKDGVSGVPSGGASEREKAEGDGEGAGGADQAKKEPSPTSTPPSTSAQLYSKPSSGHTGRGPQGMTRRPTSSFVTAANDLGAMERKLQELESRLNAMDTLPELLERKSSDMGATPIKDRWNFTNLSKRLSAAEDGLEQNSTVVDDLLGEVQSVKSAISGCEASLTQMQDKLSGDISGVVKKLKDLEDLKLAAAKDSMGGAAAAMLTELQSKIESLQTELSAVKQSVDTMDLSLYATTSDLQSALQEHSEALQQHNNTLQEASQQSSAAVAALGGRVEGVEAEMGLLSEQINELQSSKLNAADLESLLPTGDSGEAASLLPKVVQLQRKVEQIEEELSKQTALPPDVLDQITAMQKAIDKLTADLASLSSQMGSSSEERGRLEELGSEVAQLRERMSEVDRAVTALTSAVSTLRASPEAPEEEGAAKYADQEALTALQESLSQQQQEHERLIGTVAHLSNELEVNKEHVKALYSSVDDLSASKADREQMEVEVREKADRTALEGKASREWVDSTFERLDQKIREARDKLLSQEEALRSAVSRLNEDVETKLDRMELEPLKDYFDKKLARVKTAPAVVEKEVALADDAAGFRKPLRFRCISCDKPLGIKSTDAVPALPTMSMMPGTRSFRPYTTYELELIRKHQRMGIPAFGPMMEFSRGLRTAGGSHTLTHTRRRVRVAPLSSVYSPEPYTTPPPQSSAHNEVDVMGQDGHIYKGRMTTRSKLPPLKDDSRRGRPTRPTPSSYQQ